MNWRRSFLSRIFGGDTDEGETRLYTLGEINTRSREEETLEEQSHGFTVERAAQIIDDLPSDVPQSSAVHIVRRTLEAAGIKVEDLERSTRKRESKLGSEIEFAHIRQQDLRKKTEEVVRSLEEEIRKAREARDTGIAEEDENIARAEAEREEVRRVRDFFAFPEMDEEAISLAEEPGDSTGDETEVLNPLDLEDDPQATRRPDALADPESTTDQR